MATESITYSINELNKAVDFILKHNTSKTLLFYGEVGAGKTTLIKALVKALGSSHLVTSPTFSLVNDYSTQTNSIYHFDLYRLETTEELYDFGIEDYLTPTNWLLIEWPQLIEPILYGNFNNISIFGNQHEIRTLTIKY